MIPTFAPKHYLHLKLLLTGRTFVGWVDRVVENFPLFPCSRACERHLHPFHIIRGFQDVMAGPNVYRRRTYPYADGIQLYVMGWDATTRSTSLPIFTSNRTVSERKRGEQSHLYPGKMSIRDQCAEQPTYGSANSYKKRLYL